MTKDSMQGILIITHAKLAMELLGAAEFILGRLEKVETLSIEADNNPQQMERQLARAVERLKEPDGVLILTDMFGGTPNNISLTLLESNKVEVVTGVNLPMLIKAATSRKGQSLSQLAAEVCRAGQEAISVAGELLNP